jgi:uncharacterized protein YkwD
MRRRSVKPEFSVRPVFLRLMKGFEYPIFHLFPAMCRVPAGKVSQPIRGPIQMKSSREPTGKLVYALAAGLAAAALAGCAEKAPPPSEPSFYRSLAQEGGELDAIAAQSMVSGYRQNNALEGVTLDPALMKLADEQARAMAQRDKLDRNIIRPFPERLKRAGYAAKISAENVGAGYHTLAEAFSGWRDSPPHRANMLLKGATRIGIAAVYAPKSKYKVFWTLILAAPAD